MNYKALEVEFISRKNANDTSNNGMYIERGNARIKRTVSDLCDAIADSKKVVLFEYEMRCRFLKYFDLPANIKILWNKLCHY